MLMSKIDNIFLKIISDEQLANRFDIDPSKYSNIDGGKKAANKYVKAIAELIEQLNVRINNKKDEMKIRHKTGTVALSDVDFQAVYKSIVSVINKK